MAVKTRTGYCSIGLHEGTKPKNTFGTALPVCVMWQTCNCECHERITQMFTMAEEDRVPMENSEYQIPKHTYYMPVFGVDYGVKAEPSFATLGSDGQSTEGPLPYGTGGATGRKGALEASVLDVCRTFDPASEQPATPKWISEQIAEKNNCRLPSTGAVQACLDRWAEIGFALVGRKPVRFAAFTPEGERDGLYLMKAKAKRSK